MLDKIQNFISIIAAVVVAIVSIVQKISIDKALIRMVIAITVFYILGLLVRSYLRRNVFYDKEAKEEEESTNTDDEKNSSYDIEDEFIEDKITKDDQFENTMNLAEDNDQPLA